MGGVVRLLLVVGLLIAHSPVCKITAAHAMATSLPHLAHAKESPGPRCKKSCCQGKQQSPQPKQPTPDKPPKPDCPNNGPCPLCGPLPGLVALSNPAIPTDLLLVDDLLIASHVLIADGFHMLLDRPPRG